LADAVIVTDMVRGFLEEGNPLYCGARARRIISSIHALLDRELEQDAEVLFLCDRHAPDDPEFAMFPAHCVEGTHEAELIPELAGYKGEVIPKGHFSAFCDTPLDDRLAHIKPDKLIVCGVCTDICVLHTVADARSRGYRVEVPADCVASINEAGHRFALEHMHNVLGVELTAGGPDKVELSKFPPSPEVLCGDTADVYLARTIDILQREGLDPTATMEVFSSRDGVLCGIEEVKSLLGHVLPRDNSEVWALVDGGTVAKKEVVLRITAPYQSYGLYETAIDGMLGQGTGWATAARECVDAAGGIPVVSFGARHVHPAIAGVMDYAAVVGGCQGCSSIIGARLAGVEPSGTMPHALIIIMGDTVTATLAFDKHMPAGVPRVSLVDTFRDEAEESLRVAQALGEKLDSVRLDTPGELGGVTPAMVAKVRATLDGAGFGKVKIFVSGGITPQRITGFLESGAPVDGFGVGSYIAGAAPIDFTADIHQVDGKPIAKRGRTPGITVNPRLKRVI